MVFQFYHTILHDLYEHISQQAKINQSNNNKKTRKEKKEEEEINLPFFHFQKYLIVFSS